MNAPRTPDSGVSLHRSLAVLVGSACAISLITFGLRSIFGLFTDPVVQGQGWSREVFALAIAIQNLFWGIGQPFAGALVDRFGPVRPLAVGGVLSALGIAVMAVAPSPLGLQLSAGALVGLGTTLANGCTSGHGVCGVARLSKRSIVATVSFMGAGMAAVYLVRRLMEASS